MATASTRRAALRALIEKEYDGVARRFALAVGKPEGQINDMLSTPPRKAFGEKVARQIELKLGLSEGALDTDPDQAPMHQVKQDTALYEFNTPAIKRATRIMRDLDQTRQDQVVSFAKHLLAEQRKADKNSTLRAG